VADELAHEGILAKGDKVVNGEYSVQNYIAGGNSGEVYRLGHPRHGENRVLKLFVPFFQLRQPQLGQDEEQRGERTRQIIEEARNQPYQRREYAFLSKIDHPYIVKVHDFGLESLTVQQTDRLKASAGAWPGGAVQLPYILAAFVEGSSFDEGLTKLDRLGVFRVLRSIAEAIDYLHTQHDILHLDIKSGNVRVRPDGYPILLDFALSQDLSPAALAADGEVKGGIDWDLTPFRRGTSGVANFINRVQNDGMPRSEFRAEAFPGIDLFQFGLMIRQAEDVLLRFMTPAEQSYLRLVVDELTDWGRVSQMEPGGLAGLMRRVDATQFFFAIRPGSMSGGKEMPLSNGRTVFVPPKLVPVVNHPEMTRLNRLNQLSLLPAQFSGATHSRYEHSLDVFRLAQSTARRLLDDPLCRRLFTEADVEALVTTALLHDINHLPLTHLYQESGLPILQGRDLFEDSLNETYAETPSLAETLSSALGQDPQRIHRLINGTWEEQESPADGVISSVVNSGVDLDKLSYLKLDSERSGLGFASGVDVDGLLRSMSVVHWEKHDGDGTFVHRGYHVAFPDAAMPLIEALAMARASAFEGLYWCSDNRAMMAQFLACARAIGEAEDGLDLLAELMLEVRADTDFAVLRRLDELAEQAVGRSWNLSRLFDTIGGARPTLIYSASEPWEKIHALIPSDRVRFETELRAGLADVLPSVADGPQKLMVDVPRRPLDLGGEILGIDRSGNVRRAVEASQVLREQKRRLERLARQVRMFVPPDVHAEWVEGAEELGTEEMERIVGHSVRTALGKATFR
jgi:HD superfamily phosphohydrolase